MSSIAINATDLSLFRLYDDTRDSEPVLDELEDVELPGIRCPLCKWRPRKSDWWQCADCDHPEYFYGGCGTEWNTFETGGICPTCSHQWQWTSCYRCLMWSKHADWYEKEAGS